MSEKVPISALLPHKSSKNAKQKLQAEHPAASENGHCHKFYGKW
jgi:hypothetical protein